MSARKTFPVAELRDRINHMLEHSADDKREARQALGVLLEGVLHDTGNYRGFNHLHPRPRRRHGRPLERNSLTTHSRQDNTMTDQPRTVRAARILPGDRLWIIPVDPYQPWAGPIITEVIRNLDRVTIRTENGGEQTFSASEYVDILWPGDQWPQRETGQRNG